MNMLPSQDDDPIFFIMQLDPEPVATIPRLIAILNVD
jgi:hypothetical protein